MFSAVFKTKGSKAWLFLQPSGGVVRVLRVVRLEGQKQRDEFPGFEKLRGWVKTGSNMEQVVVWIQIDLQAQHVSVCSSTTSEFCTGRVWAHVVWRNLQSEGPRF